jgi:NAD(P)-dependent dehydrogenase (short-subunit alcohol dehydrogenase family)
MALSLKPLSEQVIVITGASSGIGLATAQMAADRGAKVVLVARNSEALDEIVVGINNRGGKALHVDADVADEDTAERIADRAIEAFGGFDTWVNNAAAALYARLEDVSIAEHRRVFDVGYFGLVLGSLEAARHLRTRGGAIINVGSILSDRAVPVQGAYSAMKHAVRGFTDAFRMELENEGAPISVTLIKPNGMDTPYPEHARNKMGKPARIPPVVYDPRLSAKAILFCAENVKRNLIVGGGGLPIKLANLWPSAADAGMEAIMDEKGQTTRTPPAPGTSDNLFEERVDGRIDSNQEELHVRRQSLYLEAQMRPVAATAIISGAVAVAAGAIAFASKRRHNTAMQAALTAKDVKARLPESTTPSRLAEESTPQSSTATQRLSTDEADPTQPATLTDLTNAMGRERRREPRRLGPADGLDRARSGRRSASELKWQVH